MLDAAASVQRQRRREAELPCAVCRLQLAPVLPGNGPGDGQAETVAAAGPGGIQPIKPQEDLPAFLGA